MALTGQLSCSRLLSIISPAPALDHHIISGALYLFKDYTSLRLVVPFFFSIAALSGKANKWENKRKVKSKIDFYFDSFIFFFLPPHRACFVPEQQKQLLKCTSACLSNEGRGSHGNTKMVASCLFFKCIQNKKKQTNTTKPDSISGFTQFEIKDAFYSLFTLLH